ncbi:MAG TPA: hypothetical protein DCS91_16675 [Microcoleaceae bacterium UBA11344]|nr:hypothetical protein [Microcoleaceae cyanobacterium UBA11344]
MTIEKPDFLEISGLSQKSLSRNPVSLIVARKWRQIVANLILDKNILLSYDRATNILIYAR